MVKHRPDKSRGQTREETRHKLLEAGYELLKEQPVGDILSQVKATEVARRAGLTAGAIYYHWDDQDAYRRDLLNYVFTRDPARQKQVVDDAIQQAKEHNEGFEEILRAAAVADFEQLKERTSLPVMLALWGKHETDPEVKEYLRQRFQELDKQFIPLYKETLAEHHLKMRPPFTVEMLAAIITALIEGLLVRWAVDPEAVPDKLPEDHIDSEPWNLFSAVVLALVPAMTVPIEPHDDDLGLLSDKDVRTLVHSLRKAYEEHTPNKEQ